MIAVNIADRTEWLEILNLLSLKIEECNSYPFGEYFITKINDVDTLFFRGGTRKANCSASTQYMICEFNVDTIINIGTCAGIGEGLKPLDIVIPNKAIQYDCMIEELGQDSYNSFEIDINIPDIVIEYKSGTVGTADKAVILWKDYIRLKDNDITIADTETAAIAHVCSLNNVSFLAIRGISDIPKDITDSLYKQTNDFETNTPLVIRKIFNDYLIKVIELLKSNTLKKQ